MILHVISQILHILHAILHIILHMFFCIFIIYRVLFYRLFDIFYILHWMLCLTYSASYTYYSTYHFAYYSACFSVYFLAYIKSQKIGWSWPERPFQWWGTLSNCSSIHIHNALRIPVGFRTGYLFLHYPPLISVTLSSLRSHPWNSPSDSSSDDSGGAGMDRPR